MTEPARIDPRRPAPATDGTIPRPGLRAVPPAEIHDQPLPGPDPFLPGPAGIPDAVDPSIPDSARTVSPTEEARQGETYGRIRWVLGIGLVLVVLGFAASYLIGAR